MRIKGSAANSPVELNFSRHEIEIWRNARLPSMHNTNANELRGPCPVHKGKNPNFSFNVETAFSFCHSKCGRGWDLIGLEMELTGADFQRAKASVFDIVGRARVPHGEESVEAIYPYTDADGTALYQVLRYRGKDFRQRRPDGRGGWVWKLGDVRRVPYHLPKLVKADFAFIVEGERDVETAERLGAAATCNSGGAGHFRQELATYFRDKQVAIIPDNDDKGREHAFSVAALLSGVAKSVRIIELPGVPLKGDLTDWVEAGGTVDELRELYKAAAEWTPDWVFSSDTTVTDAATTPPLVEMGTSEERPYPADLAPEAFRGPVGELVVLIDPHTESDRNALLVQTLVAMGNLIGRHGYFQVEGDKHYANLFLAIVGRSSKARKGTSWGRVRSIVQQVDEEWVMTRHINGIGSGEGIIWAVRDPVYKGDKLADPGEADKRLLVQEPEFARLLQVSERAGSTVYGVIRDAFDVGVLNNVVKKEAVRATGAHISIIAHITKAELNRTLTDTAAANGFGNRFLWACARRSKFLPDGGDFDAAAAATIIERLKAAVEFAKDMQRIKRDDEAREIWRAVYRDLSGDRPGLSGVITGRAEALVVRLSLLYALLDCSPVIQAVHLNAALAVWKYCEDSARYIFGDALGDPLADEILRLLRLSSDGCTRTTISAHFHRNRKSEDINRALGVLAEFKLARSESRLTSGRSEEVWLAC
jgi:hypothetical protein